MWTEQDSIEAQKEGWDIKTSLELVGSPEASELILRKALNGSVLHRKAIQTLLDEPETAREEAITSDFDKSFSLFLAKLKLRVEKYFSQHPKGKKPVIEYTEGKQYIRVMDSSKDKHAVCFISKATGDIYYPKGFDQALTSSPVRGNVYSPENGMEAIDETGLRAIQLRSVVTA